MPALFSGLTLVFAAIGLDAAAHGEWIIAVAGAALAVWMGSFARAALRRMRS
jgi:hypothetical protein